MVMTKALRFLTTIVVVAGLSVASVGWSLAGAANLGGPGHGSQSTSHHADGDTSSHHSGHLSSLADDSHGATCSFPVDIDCGSDHGVPMSDSCCGADCHAAVAAVDSSLHRSFGRVVAAAIDSDLVGPPSTLLERPPRSKDII